MKDYLRFDKLITPVLIRVIFWVGIVFIAVCGAGMIVMGIAGSGGGMAVLLGILGMPVAALLWRVNCEVLLVIFGISEKLGEIRDGLAEKPARAKKK